MHFRVPAARDFGARGRAGFGFIIDHHASAAAGHTYADGDGGDDDLVVIDSNRTTVLGGGGNDVLLLNTDVNQITSDSELWVYGLGGSDVFDIYGGIIHHDATKLDDVNFLPPP